MIILIKNVFVTSARLVFKNLKFVTLYFAVNICFSLALTLPVFSLIKESLQHSALNTHYTGEFDYLWFIQFITLNKQSLNGIPGLIYIITIIYNLIQLFFSGGLLGVLNSPQKNHIVDFFFGSVRYFFRFLVLFCIALVLYFVLISLNTVLNFSIISVFENSQSVRLEFVAQLIRYLFFIFCIGIINIIFDYSKIIVISNERMKLHHVIVKSFLFIKHNMSLVFSVYFITGSCVIVAAIFYNIFDSYIPKTSLGLLIVTFFIQQLLIIFRLIIKMLFSATELAVYNDLNAEIIDAHVEEVSTGV